MFQHDFINCLVVNIIKNNIFFLAETTPSNKNLTKRRPLFAIKHSPYYKCNPKSPFLLKNKLKQHSKHLP